MALQSRMGTPLNIAGNTLLLSNAGDHDAVDQRAHIEDNRVGLEAGKRRPGPNVPVVTADEDVYAVSVK